MRIDPGWIQAAAAIIAALMGAMYAVITRPLLKRMDDIRADLALFKTSTETDLRAIHAELKTQGERLTRVEGRLPPPLVHR